ncbi:BRO family protein [Desulfovibrio sp. ZJ200]|uniref:BRO-N domain-containing protein n=1 Tax=Desulfovibrio sp. ZJ200 TaxID=2709792 RepID=UPI0013EA985A|nr:BRO family protein [Desulfovibrio sp. ZJ200]
MEMALTFNDVTLSPVTHQNRLWIRAVELARALGFKREDQAAKIYRAHADEFTPDMAQLVEIIDNADSAFPVKSLLFSLRGCHLLAMFARTPVAKAFRRWVLDVLDKLAEEERAKAAPAPTSEPSPISKRTDPERKALTAIINTWVGMAPIHYANARAQVNAHFGVASVDALTVAQVKEAIQWVQSKIDALPPAREQAALPPVPKKDKFEAYIEQVEALRARTDAEIRRLLGEGLNLVDVYKFGPEGIRGFSSIFHNWLHEVAVSPSPLVASYWSMERAIEYSPLHLIRELEKILPDLRCR